MTDARSLLIVDDDAPFRERLVRAMRDRGYEARGVADHPSAVDAARDESPVLALVDLRPPGQSGLAVVRELKALDPSTIVVVLTRVTNQAVADIVQCGPRRAQSTEDQRVNRPTWTLAM
jgi:two-component system response regulator RegA